MYNVLCICNNYLTRCLTCMEKTWLVKILNEFEESEKKKEGNINLNVTSCHKKLSRLFVRKES